MSRLEIDFPEKFDFSIEIPMRKIDTDYGLHVGFDKYFSLIGEGYYRYMDHHGISPDNIWGTDVALVFGDASIIYGREIRHDDLIRIESGSYNFKDKTFDYITKLSKKNGEILVSKSKFTVLCMDHNLRKAISIPERVLQTLKR
ncbi:MAG: thioesterase family protein [Spirochaetota bacterium]